MEITRLSSKGQLVIPKWLRDRHNWKEGDEFVVVDVGHGVLLRPKNPFPETTLNDVVGSMSYSGPSYTVEEMDEAIAQAIREKFGDSG